LIGKPTIVRIARAWPSDLHTPKWLTPVGSEHVPHVAAATDDWSDQHAGMNVNLPTLPRANIITHSFGPWACSATTNRPSLAVGIRVAVLGLRPSGRKANLRYSMKSWLQDEIENPMHYSFSLS
jgi:hypothetical protein